MDALPNPDQLRGYGHAVAGHAGTLCDEDGKLFIKPCTQTEIEFYESAQRNYPEFAEIMPTCMGTLMLTDPNDQRIGEAVTGVISEAGDVKTDKEQISAAVTEQIVKAAAPAAAAQEGHHPEWVPTGGGKIKTDTAIVLENSSYGFKKPNILDVKLGVRLWADDAPAKKKQKFDKITSETTHKSYGFRIAGMRTYHGTDDASKLDEDGYRVYDKHYGQKVKDDELPADIGRFIFNESAGIDKELGNAVADALINGVEHIEDILTRHETRMYSASLLFVFEGDGDALREAIKQNNEAVAAVEAAKNDPNRAAKRVDSGIVLDEDGEFADDDDASLASLMESLPPIFSVKLIDFAHAQWAPGQGPDENMLKGIRSIKKIFKDLRGNDDTTTKSS